jgi:hypothetical protein
MKIKEFELTGQGVLLSMGEGFGLFRPSIPNPEMSGRILPWQL